MLLLAPLEYTPSCFNTSFFLLPNQSKEMEQQMQDELLKAISELQMVSEKECPYFVLTTSPE